MKAIRLMEDSPDVLSEKLQALLGERRDLRMGISLEAQRTDADAQRLLMLSKRLIRVERAIEVERATSK